MEQAGDKRGTWLWTETSGGSFAEPLRRQVEELINLEKKLYSRHSSRYFKRQTHIQKRNVTYVLSEPFSAVVYPWLSMNFEEWGFNSFYILLREIFEVLHFKWSFLNSSFSINFVEILNLEWLFRNSSSTIKFFFSKFSILDFFFRSFYIWWNVSKFHFGCFFFKSFLNHIFFTVLHFRLSFSKFILLLDKVLVFAKFFSLDYFFSVLHFIWNFPKFYPLYDFSRNF